MALITISPVSSVHNTRRLFRDLISQHSLDSWKPKEDDNPSALGVACARIPGIDADDSLPRQGPDRNAVLQSRSAPACQRQRTGDKPWSSGVWHALPVWTCAARCTAFPTDGLLSRPRTRARWASTTATPHPDDVTGRLVRPSGSIGCTLCRSSCAIPDLGRAAGWLFGLPPGRIGIF